MSIIYYFLFALRQQQYKCDDTEPEPRYLKALGAFSALAEAEGSRPSSYHPYPERSEFASSYSQRPVDGRERQPSPTDFVIQYIPPKKVSCFKDMGLYEGDPKNSSIYL